MAIVTARGIIVAGHRVASGEGGDPRFPAGTIAPQLPFFERLVPGFTAHLRAPAHPGTINLGFPGRAVAIRAPEHHLPDIAWTPLFPPESFHLARAWLTVAGETYPAFLYLPDPATKPDHHQPRNIVELLAGFVPGARYGAEATLAHDDAAIAIMPAA